MELLVVIVVLGVLAALLIPSFRAVTNRAHDGTALAELSAVQRAAAALSASFDGEVGYTQQMLEQVLPAALDAADEPVTAGGFSVLETGESSEAHGQVSWASDGRALGLAMRSNSGRCVYTWADGATQTDTDVRADAPGQCVAPPFPDGTPPAGGDTGGTPPVDPFEPRHPSWAVGPGPESGRTIHEPVLSGGVDASEGIPGAGDIFAVSSFPSAHVGDHKLYATSGLSI